jgi:STE24 endopeptidase
MRLFTQLFLAALAAHLAVQCWLARRQVRFVTARRATVPAAFRDSVTPDEHARAADYAVAKQRFGIVEAVTDAVVVLGMTLGGGIAFLAAATHHLTGSPLLSGTALVVGTFWVLSLLGLPFRIYRTFVLEHRFGFNRTTPAVFAADVLKGWLLGATLGGSFAASVIWLMSALGSAWWLAAWLAWTGFTLVLTWAWPRLLAPMFNRFTPLDDPSLRGRIDALVSRCGFRTRAVFVMDGSRRSAHANAYFTGLGREKRIVFFDTLLARLTDVQLEAVLAHELGHFRLRHVTQRLAVGIAGGFAGFAVLGWLSARPWFYSGLGVSPASDAAALMLFVLAAPAFTWFLAPLSAAWSRHHEFQADDFAARHADAGALADGLVALYRDNATTLTPDPVYALFHESHPSPATRVERLRRAGAATRPIGATA